MFGMSNAFWLMIGGWAFVLVWVPLTVLSQRKVHPKALFTLFFAEMWERFSFYGMRALLILYMSQELFASLGTSAAETKSYGIYGAYGALVYATPVIGGLLADRLLGFRKAIMLGGILMAIGHFLLAFEGSEFLFFASLSFIILGNGFFKPNVSSFLGTFYELNDNRKDRAYTLFYMGVNVGAFLAPITCGYVGQEVAWFWGFSLAGFGMLLGLLVFWRNIVNFHDKGLPPNPEYLSKPLFAGLNPYVLTIIATIATIPIITALLSYNEIMAFVLPVLGIIVLGYILYTALQETKETGQRLFAFMLLFFFHMVFWALFEQAGGSLTIFASKNVDLMGFQASQLQFVNPLFIILLAPAFSWLWGVLKEKGMEPFTPYKFMFGLLQLALGFAVVVLAAQYFATDGMIPLGFLIMLYFFHTTGELSVSPVGLSIVTKLSPPKIVGLVMGTWFLSISFAHEIAAILGKMTTIPSDTATKMETLTAYTDVYWTWGVLVVVGAAVFLMLVSPLLKKWMHGVH